IVKANKALSAGKLIRKLNPLIRGWALYHQHVVSKETFTTIDDVIHRLVRQWTKRRHHKKPMHGLRRNTSKPSEKTSGCSTEPLKNKPTISQMPHISLSNGISRSVERPTRMILRGKTTTKNV